MSKYQLFGKLRQEEYDALEADIKARGVKVPIEKDGDGNTLDGHNREEIAAKLGIPCPVVQRDFASEEEKREHVIKLNLARRHLEPYEWGKAFLMLCDAKGMEQKSGARNDLTSVTFTQVAQQVGVNPETAKKRVQQAKRFDALPANEKKAVRNRKKTLTQACREQREQKREVKRQENAAKVARSESPATLQGVYSTIVIDPPWDWGDEGDVNQLGRAKPDYATMSIEQLTALPVATLADKDAHLYLWITNRSLPKGFGLLDAWCFRYVTMLTWPKPSFGMGNYFRGQTEHVLFGVRGSLSLKVKDAPTLLPAWSRGKRHSEKPAFTMLCAVFSEKWVAWKTCYKTRVQSSRKNWKEWHSECIFVPRRTLWAEIYRKFAGAPR